MRASGTCDSHSGSFGSRGDVVRAREAAQRALELDERLGAAHAALGWARLSNDWDFPGARAAYERAVELSPSDPSALNTYDPARLSTIPFSLPPSGSAVRHS